MALNLLIGVGGTGAKVVEAALVAFLAGLGPPAVTVGFVDQDESNGNVDRTRDLLARSAAFRRLWSGERPDVLDFGDPAEGGLPFGRTVTDALTVPTAAVRQGAADGRPFVYRISAQSTVENTPVQLGVVDERAAVAEVLSGLRAGDRVIVGNVGTLGRGMKVVMAGEREGGGRRQAGGGPR